MTSSVKLLLVDDEIELLESGKKLLELSGYDVTTAQNGEQAIERLKVQDFDLAILDLNMPGVTGIEVLGFIKRDPLARDIPVVFVTAEDDPGTQQRVRDAGALDYLIKPLDFDKLEEILDTTLLSSVKSSFEW